MASKEKQRKKVTSCGGVVWRRSSEGVELLLIKQFKHHDRWGIAKGHIDEGETPEACAVREIREETGVDVVLGRRLPDATTSFRNENKTVMCWLAKPTGRAEPQHDDPNSEVADARWFNVKELPELLTYQRILISYAIEVINAMEVDPMTFDEDFYIPASALRTEIVQAPEQNEADVKYFQESLTRALKIPKEYLSSK